MGFSRRAIWVYLSMKTRALGTCSAMHRHPRHLQPHHQALQLSIALQVKRLTSRSPRWTTDRPTHPPAPCTRISTTPASPREGLSARKHAGEGKQSGAETSRLLHFAQDTVHGIGDEGRVLDPASSCCASGAPPPLVRHVHASLRRHWNQHAKSIAAKNAGLGCTLPGESA
jgi:hypothetical protein